LLFPANEICSAGNGGLKEFYYETNILHDIQLPAQGTNGNGKGAPAAPTTMDLNGDGTVEIVVQTFGVGCFVFTVPDSAENQLLWPTGRGNYFRDGRPWSEAIKYCPGDLDRDNDIDGRDLALFAGDFDTDGYMGGKDLAAFAADFGRTACP